MELGARPKVKKQSLKPSDDNEETGDSIEKLPDEILEYILGMVSPYSDLDHCSLVSIRWSNIVSRVISLRYQHFLAHSGHGSLLWSHQPVLEDVSSISKRYSHCAVYYPHNCSMFVFGGCTSTSSTFNDLWELNLSTRTWRRPLSMGAYPSPKACASLVRYQDMLVLFGGWTHPSLYPLHQSWKLFSELHIYHVTENRWSLITGDQDTARPPAMAGHSATVHDDKMVVFGGLHKQRSVGHYSSSNDVWVFSLVEHVWERVLTGGVSSPLARYGQSQLVLDTHHLLVLGGCGGPNNEYTDIWLLDMSCSPWTWHQMEVEGGEHRARDIWCHPGVRVGDKVVVLGKSRTVTRQSSGEASWNVIPQLRRGINRGQASIRHRPAPAQRHEAVSSSDSDMDLAVEPVTPPLRSVDDEDNISVQINNLGNNRQQQTYRTSVNLNINNPAPGPSHHAPGPSSLPPSNPVNAPNALIPVKVTPSHSKVFGPAANTGHQDPSLAGPLARHLSSAASSSSSSAPGAPGNPESSSRAVPGMKNRQKMLENRQRQLASLQRMEEKIRNSGKNNTAHAQSRQSHKSSESSSVCPHHRMTTHILDISQAISHHRVTWLPVSPLVSPEAPQESILYSLVMGRTELIMFGGLQKDVSINNSGGRGQQNNSETVSNCLYYLNPPPMTI